MNDEVSIITYHYVRDLDASRYPRIHGLPVRDFRRQIEYIQDRYAVISGEHLIGALTGDAELPPDAALLTFDDGYLDHYTSVFPVLDDAGLPACFFPPTRAVIDREVLDVNKIHYILASTPDVQDLEDTLFDLLAGWGDGETASSRETYRQAVTGDHRFDDPQVVLIKRLLQRELPDELRRRILDQLFDDYVDVSESVLAKELYMTMDQVETLHRHGMYIGSHGSRHAWMDRLEAAEQRADVDRSLSFLEAVGTPTDEWIMCYPYGAHDAALREYIREQGCVAGLTFTAGVADIDRDDALKLPRLDTNDVPRTVDGDAHPSSASG